MKHGAGDAGKLAGEVLPILDQALDGDSLYQLRASVAAHATQAGLPPVRADDLVIAVHELAANVVRHGSGHGRLRIWALGDTLHCQVTDDGAPQAQGAGAAPEAAASPDQGPAIPQWRIEPGHGLWLVRQLADRTSLRPGAHGSDVTISFTLGAASALSPFGLDRTSGFGCTVLAISGRLDLNSAGRLSDAVDNLIAAEPAPRLVIDLAGLTFWDPFGLAALLRAQSHIDASPAAQMILAGLPDQLARHMEETGLTGRFRVAASADEAISEVILPP